MLCETVLGNLNDPAFADGLAARLGAGYEVDPVDFAWEELFKRIHRKTSAGGRAVGVRLDDKVLSRGLSEGDVLGVDETGAAPVVVAVRLLPARCLVIDVAPDHPFQLAKVGWEVGNTHTPLFFGEGPHQVLCPYSEPLARSFAHVHGVACAEAERVLDPARRVSAARHVHSHGAGHEHSHA